MNERIEFETPENILVSYKPAGLGSRFVAWIIDSIITHILVIGMFVSLIAMGVAFDGLFSFVDEGVAQTLFDDKDHTSLMIGIYLSLLLLVINMASFFYFFMFEYFGHGRTLGKRLMSLRVIGEDGVSLSSGKVFLRNVFRIVDSIPLAWLVPLFSKRSKRLGDMVGGTLVIEDRPGKLDDAHDLPMSDMPRQYRFSPAGLDGLSAEQVRLVAQLIERADSMDTGIRKDLCRKTVAAMAALFAHEVGDEAWDRYLEELLHSYYERQHRRLG